MKIGSPVWHCPRTSAAGADIITYGNPVKYTTRFNYITVQPARVALNNMAGFYTTEEFGEHTAMGWNMMANIDAFQGKIACGDLMYIDGKSPDANATNGQGANALVTSVREQNKMIYYTLQKIEGE